MINYKRPKYPALEEIGTASDYALLTWYRFLLSPSTDMEQAIMDKIVENVKLRSLKK